MKTIKNEVGNNKIKNTSKDPNPEWLLGGNPNAIEAQEAQGQKELVTSDVLPVNMRGGHYDCRTILESLGFKFLGIIEGDEIFQNVEMPSGWKIKPTDHSMHSDLIDDKGRVRAGIFYKAAFYDRSAHMSLTIRYNYSIDYDKLDCGIVTCHVKDQNDKIIFSTPEHTMTEAEIKEQWNVQDKHNEIAKEWLSENYPEWENPEKYWDC